ncbi:hypothetical protein [Nonomuraea endophytica]|uniref:hypothetical protein n=1 Tax=Nonomuraea endophytica TaxID=714136 RepID=UPI0037CB64C4
MTTISPAPARSGAMAADLLQAQLKAAHGIDADVNQGDGDALVSVWRDLVVWCDPTGSTWWWRTGRRSTQGPRKGRRIYRFASTSDVTTAAQRIACRYADLQRPQSDRPGAASPGDPAAVTCGSPPPQP